MKYGKTERISGIVILLALLAIFVPWLMSDPAPREERPQPSFVIEQPVQVTRQDVPAPEMPSTVNVPASSVSSENVSTEDVASASQESVDDSNDSSNQNSSTSSAPASTSQGEWAVQVGSFGEAANAQRLSDQLSQAGFNTYTRERDNNLTTVYVGPYATSDDGESAMSIIKQRANVQGLLVRVRD
ncbi:MULTISPECIES: SPOR domain-containing protein [Vreelandella]|uniref:SPOR domain-containing protein n=2 Tax=Vreelandella TaxID=3137766 RepID=A0A7C9JV28_9GAMM|nr:MULTISPECIES: SPOR domain-containing protein [Halomonas]NDL72003.1 SPOR domain-containing protein [Halomonas alkaliphila]NYS45718.1 SPOR domain-containing protein [Halomonas zhaodongensis]